uniref:Uncharacterized protein n=1 Tax=Trichogramma kaykai TaxID=54128 RepID=A0ABD2WCA6_9HYME
MTKTKAILFASSQLRRFFNDLEVPRHIVGKARSRTRSAMSATSHDKGPRTFMAGVHESTVFPIACDTDRVCL